eukprot:gene3906-7790_t
MRIAVISLSVIVLLQVSLFVTSFHLYSPSLLARVLSIRTCSTSLREGDSNGEVEVLATEVVGQYNDDELDVGDLENMDFKRISRISPTIAKYRLEGTIKSKELNSYLEDYKEEMKRRKVTFPGFRAGKLPPYVMTDVRRYILCYGMELNLGNLCNMNEIIMSTESGEDVAFGEDSYYDEIFLKDFRDYDFQKQRDAWKEGTDFSFIVEFFARDNVDAKDKYDTDNISVEDVSPE